MSSQGHVVTIVPQELNLYDYNTMEEEMEVEHHDQVSYVNMSVILLSLETYIYIYVCVCVCVCVCVYGF